MSAGLDLSIAGDTRSLTKHLSKTQKKIIPQAAATALNKTTAKAKTLAKRTIVKKTRLAQKLFKRQFKVFKARPKNLASKIWVGLKKGARLKDIPQGKRKKILKSLGGSKPFRVTLKSGRTGTFVRVKSTGSRKGSKGWTKGRSRTSSKNLPIIDHDSRMVVFLPDDTRELLQAATKTVFDRDFKKIFKNEIKFRLKKLGKPR